MKSILLTTTAIVAFAGAAAAEVSFSGSATLGYNDEEVFLATTATNTTTNWTTSGTTTTGTTTAVDDNYGFYWDANLSVVMSEELDNGITAAVEANFDLADMDTGSILEAGDYVLSLTSDTAGLYFGKTSFAAETKWASAGDMEADGFSEADGETVLRGDFAVAMVEASVSMVIADVDGNRANDAAVVAFTGVDKDYDQISVGMKADLGQFSVALGYQEEAELGSTGNGDYTTGEVFGISASTSFSGADVTVAYAENNGAGTQSYGAKVAYPFGPVTATAYYVVEESNAGTVDDNYGVKVAYASGAIAVSLDYQDDQGTGKTDLNASYDIGNGFMAYAGYYNQENVNDDEFYVAGTYDLGGGASLLVAYAEGDSNTDDEIGANDYQRGTTVEVSFAF